MMDLTPSQRLAKVRAWLMAQGYDALIVPMTDPFQSEYTHAIYQRINRLIGFQGSAGTVIVTRHGGVLMTDSRYSLQAKSQLGDLLPASSKIDHVPPLDGGDDRSGDTFEIQEASGINAVAAYLKDKADGSSYKVVVDGSLLTVAQVEALTTALMASPEDNAHAKAISLVLHDQNPVDEVLGLDAFAVPNSPPCSPLFNHDLSYAGQSHQDKIAAIFGTTNADVLVITDPLSLAWLLNMRARDIPGTPIFLGCGLVHRGGSCRIFIHDPSSSRLEGLGTVARCGDLDGDTVYSVTRCEDEGLFTFEPLSHFDKALQDMGHGGGQKGPGAPVVVSVDPHQISQAWYDKIDPATVILRREVNPCLRLKAVKNAVQQEGFRRAHLIDGVAVVRFLAWLDGCFNEDSGGNTSFPTELEAARQLDALRCDGQDFLEPSFDTISGAGPNGAIVHYRVTEASSRPLHRGDVYLVDSGGQYPSGTTDVTRTVLIGSQSCHSDAPEMFTRVLKGHIALATARFPRGIGGWDLDVLARRSLWDAGVSYGHGTGHGVGHFLSVHESPPNVSRGGQNVPFEPGMIVSNEPGYYKENAYGIRIESLLLCVPCSEKTPYLGFETLTLVPIDKKLIVKDLLTRDELAWLNGYHERVLESIGPRVTPWPEVKDWLEAACSPL